MWTFVLRTLANAVALWAASAALSGISLAEHSTGADRVGLIIVVALLFGLLNALVKPVLTFFGLPFVLLTLGLFLIIINAAMLVLTAWAAGTLGLDFTVDGFWGAAVPGAIIVTVVAWLMEAITGARE